MEIRLATKSDYKSISMSLRNKRISYITPTQAKSDIENNRLFVMVENNKILGQCALVYEPNYSYYAIKRLVVYNKKNCGRGIAERFIKYLSDNTSSDIGCTPWSDNLAMKKLLLRNGFKYQYTFLKNYEFFKKIA